MPVVQIRVVPMRVRERFVAMRVGMRFPAIPLERMCMPDLFRSVRTAWRVAGLPNPGEEAKAYM